MHVRVFGCNSSSYFVIQVLKCGLVIEMSNLIVKFCLVFTSMLVCWTELDEEYN